MASIIEFAPGVQPEYQPLTAARAGGHDHGTVVMLGAEVHTDLGRANAEVLREREAADVAAVVVQALAEGWPVWREDPEHKGAGGLQPCRPGDIAILLPSRLSLPVLQAALARAQVPYRAENSSLVYAAPEVRAIMLALRAADDPTDELAVVSALRTSLFGCSDRHLYDWKVTHGQRWRWHEPSAELAPELAAELADHRWVLPCAVSTNCTA
jgi:ATP-dependent helicase/nuclease subunit A